jgi:hypothetical protein
MVARLTGGFLGRDGLDKSLRLCGSERSANLSRLVRLTHTRSQVIGGEGFLGVRDADNCGYRIVFPVAVEVIV